MGKQNWQAQAQRVRGPAGGAALRAGEDAVLEKGHRSEAVHLPHHRRPDDRYIRLPKGEQNFVPDVATY
jgi:hypothetical protein